MSFGLEGGLEPVAGVREMSWFHIQLLVSHSAIVGMRALVSRQSWIEAWAGHLVTAVALGWKNA